MSKEYEYKVAKPGLYFRIDGKMAEAPVGATIRLKPEAKAVTRRFVTPVESEQRLTVGDVETPPAPKEPETPPAPPLNPKTKKA